MICESCENRHAAVFTNVGKMCPPCATRSGMQYALPRTQTTLQV